MGSLPTVTKKVHTFDYTSRRPSLGIAPCLLEQKEEEEIAICSNCGFYEHVCTCSQCYVCDMPLLSCECAPAPPTSGNGTAMLPTLPHHCKPTPPSSTPFALPPPHVLARANPVEKRQKLGNVWLLSLLPYAMASYVTKFICNCEYDGDRVSRYCRACICVCRYDNKGTLVNDCPMFETTWFDRYTKWTHKRRAAKEAWSINLYCPSCHGGAVRDTEARQCICYRVKEVTRLHKIRNVMDENISMRDYIWGEWHLTCGLGRRLTWDEWKGNAVPFKA